MSCITRSGCVWTMITPCRCVVPFLQSTSECMASRLGPLTLECLQTWDSQHEPNGLTRSVQAMREGDGWIVAVSKV
ncbi:uncharacterized protein B0H18DRAFT_1038524 [Fomitopsis serialis]|uniref:uncharacterized protein n=1 Tax=Fomitopsis serialis TaxID=139415 RepID=UPI00200849A5|nr:uncharacterized protein B0H18DRAFT_1038502 [Neoantrodia serialis]XP_047887701.1 uncharacterized protein B0H18DRAFT_1038506 [Neoantrodia serialis]XP_047887707.1 uncharacterized protein B0H18DRAFT_1038524 [Neoantrodia serialis]KAH9916447.1 hypothetical protein B0H18DRAFT_1038502 [Neoantrodia serialis]KAH9916449.1 hypothetical protein B0H18DRAFT_1038506 [Neoantrodia serialis]KAH9916455.1 hypothetical protein B0H18DRAFT_1038524 [Neoantrodia serialis]